MKYFVWIVMLVVATAVISGFFLVGSPREERLRRFDERRVQDLQTLQSEIINYWRLKEKLPDSLGVLRDDIRGFVPPTDPETAAPYEYGVGGLLAFQLCAAFNGVSDLQQNWEHGAGRACFARSIDPQLYPKEPKPNY